MATKIKLPFHLYSGAEENNQPHALVKCYPPAFDFSLEFSPLLSSFQMPPFSIKTINGQCVQPKRQETQINLDVGRVQHVRARGVRAAILLEKL